MLSWLFNAFDEGSHCAYYWCRKRMANMAPVQAQEKNIQQFNQDVAEDGGYPRFSYGGGKIISELMAINYGRKNFDRVMIFRPHNVYGTDMGWEHVLPKFVLRM
jgi:nucleoside-diphosphate-sugar epimerase